MGGIRVLSLTGGTIKNHSVEEAATLLKRDDALVWVDVPECSDEAVSLLTEVLRCHRLAVRDCMQRNRVPRVRIYPHQQLLILHGPERGRSRHVHYLELDQIIGEKYVATVHGPINPTVHLDVALRERDGIRKRIKARRLRPDSPYELSYAITSALTHRLESFIEDLTSGSRQPFRARRPHGGTDLTDGLFPRHDEPHAAEGRPSHRRSGDRSGALRQRLLS